MLLCGRFRFVCLVNDRYCNITFNFQKRFTVKAFFRKDSVDSLLWNVTLNGDFTFSDTFCCVRSTVPYHKIGLIIIDLWLQYISSSVVVS